MLRFTARAAGEPDWQKPRELSDALWRILFSRGCKSPDEARAFLNPSPADILDPTTLSDMAKSVEIIVRHIKSGSRICVWGDYDVDGVSASAILLKALGRMGANVFHHIPSRYTEGYGFNEEGVMSLGCDLLISVDCGISEAGIVEKALKKGMSVIVTDHHEPPEKLPDCPVINPKLAGYQNRDLCGAGTAYKLALALDPANGDLIDIAALATVADVVPLLGENRSIVALGLKSINKKARAGLRALIDAAGITGEITAQKIAFQLSPRLNASGRVKNAEKALELLMSDDAARCAEIAKELNDLNEQRRAIESRVIDDCEKALAQGDLSRAHAIILAGEGWQSGVVGLAASRLVERYNMPAILLSIDGGTMTGSCRSIPGCDIHKALTRVSSLLVKYGGHAQAAGLTLASENFEEFKKALDAAIADITPEEAFIPSVYYDCAAEIGDITLEFVSSVQALEPAGFGNPPVALMSQFTLENARRIGKDASHASFSAADETGSVRGVWFSGGAAAESLNGHAVKAVYSPYVNEFRGESSAQIQIKSIAPDAASAFCINAEREAALVNSFITQRLYNTPIVSRREGVGLSGMRKALEKPRGTLIVACGSFIASQIAALPELRNADVCVGSYPSDSRAFNALCLLPAGEMPKGYDRVIVAGAPGWLMPENALELSGAGAAGWLKEMPDVDELRAIYQKCRSFCRIRATIPDLEFLSAVIGGEAQVTPIAAIAGILILRDMGLITFELNPLKLALCPPFKTDPLENAAFRAAAGLKEWGGVRD